MVAQMVGRLGGNLVGWMVQPMADLWGIPKAVQWVD